jgi:L-2-hydroxyglutarate oxidase LhgO
MEKVDVVIIGAGVVGLAIAYELSRKRQVDMVLLEKHPYCGAETSSRNSEVIHAGMYYPGGTLKARFCVQGNRQLYELCEKQRIPYRKCGKIIVASNAEEMKKVDELFQQGKANGAPGLTMLDARQIQAMEPEVRAREALFSPETGLIDAHRLIQYYETQAQANGVLIAYNSEVVGLEKLSDGYRITVSDESGGSYDLQGALVINCAGLYADKVAALAGIDIAQYQYRIHFCKGEYFNVSNRHAGKFQRLVYPVPTAYSLEFTPVCVWMERWLSARMLFMWIR